MSEGWRSRTAHFWKRLTKDTRGLPSIRQRIMNRKFVFFPFPLCQWALTGRKEDGGKVEKGIWPLPLTDVRIIVDALGKEPRFNRPSAICQKNGAEFLPLQPLRPKSGPHLKWNFMRDRKGGDMFPNPFPIRALPLSCLRRA